MASLPPVPGGLNPVPVFAIPPDLVIVKALRRSVKLSIASSSCRSCLCPQPSSAG